MIIAMYVPPKANSWNKKEYKEITQHTLNCFTNFILFIFYLYFIYFIVMIVCVFVICVCVYMHVRLHGGVYMRLCACTRTSLQGGGGAHPSMFVSGNYLPSTQLVHLPQGHSVHHPHGHLPHLQQGHLAHHPLGHQVHLPPGHMPHPYQASKNWSHARRRDRVSPIP